MKAKAVTNPDLSKLDKDIVKLEKSIVPVIKTEEEYLSITPMLVKTKEFMKKIDEVFNPMLKAAKATVESIKDEKDKHYQPVKELDSRLRLMASDWMTKKEAERKREQAKLDAAAEKKRLALEEKNQAREEAGLAPIEKIIEAKQATAVEKGGISYRETWDFEIVNADLIPKDFFIIDTAAIGAIVRSEKSATNIPGIRVFSVKTPIVR